ncbi:acyltransferase family protein [Flavobacterium sp.]|uniref:acyltransferase family protein n=1 Tax=Flavobacterium sp. TaxID=239 RepID=UPI0025BCFA6F|nr:acyltransferase family protein [Flavobacterium sp.]MBA4277620.1 hypothetical protein [Flavobacterium sp.]
MKMPFNKPYLTGKELVYIEDVVQKKTSKIFFGGLNELRAFAALGVVIHHIEQIKGMNGLGFQNRNLQFLIHNLGKASVDLFFVLSGFLISFLLFQEKNNNNGHINISKFYLRRIYRIWPLYYFVMLLSFTVIPLLSKVPIFEFNQGLQVAINNSENYNFNTVSRYLLFLPQFANVVVGASQSWSIGLEEQFYLIMPLAITIFRKKVFFSLVLLISIVFFCLTFNLNASFDFNSKIAYFFRVLGYFNFQMLLIGVVGGYIYFYNKTKVENLTKSVFGYFILITLILLLSIFPMLENKINHFILALLFLLLILFTINNSNKFVYKNNVMSYLGKISYGIYMYHVFAIFLVYPLANKYFTGEYGDEIVFNLLLYFMVYIFTILFSILSYEFFESKFIKFKDLKFKV